MGLREVKRTKHSHFKSTESVSTRETTTSATLPRAEQSLPADLLLLLRKGCLLTSARHHLLLSSAAASVKGCSGMQTTPQVPNAEGRERKGRHCLCLLVCFSCHTYVNWDYKHDLSLHESNYTNNFNHIPVPVVSPILLKRGKRDFQNSV